MLDEKLFAIITPLRCSIWDNNINCKLAWLILQKYMYLSWKANVFVDIILSGMLQMEQLEIWLNFLILLVDNIFENINGRIEAHYDGGNFRRWLTMTKYWLLTSCFEMNTYTFLNIPLKLETFEGPGQGHLTWWDLDLLIFRQKLLTNQSTVQNWNER